MEPTLHKPLTPRERVKMALRHQEPDRVPTDFLATPEVWRKLIDYFKPDVSAVGDSEYFEPAREAVLRCLEIDCRVLSYDMFYAPPPAALRRGAVVDWWITANRSTPNRMWRQRNPDGTLTDIWGTHSRRAENPYGAYEEFVSWPWQHITSVEGLKSHTWPQPDWWDFGPMPGIIQQLDRPTPYHLRFRIGSIFELVWQLRGLQEFMIDLVTDPAIPLYIMDCLIEVHLENTRRVLELVGERLDMVYLYDDVATQDSLMISLDMWRRIIRPRYAKLVDLAHAYGKPVMYHCDGAVYRLIPDLIDLGIDVLNPVQPDAKGMDLQRLKSEFGDRLAFHGGVDIVKTLPRGSADEVAAEVRQRVQVLGQQGGYILCSSHHIQPDTPVENILAMYDPTLRYKANYRDRRFNRSHEAF